MRDSKGKTIVTLQESNKWLKQMRDIVGMTRREQVNFYVQNVTCDEDLLTFTDKNYTEHVLEVLCPTKSKARQLYESLLLDIAEPQETLKVVTPGYFQEVAIPLKNYIRKRFPG